MENIFLFKIEVVILFISLWYIFYYVWEKIYISYFKFKKIVSPKREDTIKKNRKNKFLNKNKNKTKDSDNNKKKSKNNKNNNEKKDNKNKIKIKYLLTENDKLKISEILKKVKTSSEKWYYDKSKSLIIEWLTIDKFNKDLNLELASIYEIEKNYKNAEIIYNDLSNYHENNSDIRKKLWFNLAMQNKLKESFLVYEDVIKKRRNDMGVVEMLSDISYDLKEFTKCLKYLNLFLKEKPRSVEKIFMKWICLENTSKKIEAVEVYKRILDLQPYNTDARDKIRKLEKKS